MSMNLDDKRLEVNCCYKGFEVHRQQSFIYDQPRYSAGLGFICPALKVCSESLI